MDATPLFCMLLADYARATGDLALVRVERLVLALPPPVGEARRDLVDVVPEPGERGARGRTGEMAGVRRPSQPWRLAHDHRGQP